MIRCRFHNYRLFRYDDAKIQIFFEITHIKEDFFRKILKLMNNLCQLVPISF